MRLALQCSKDIANVNSAAMTESAKVATHRELTRLVIKANMSHMYRILRSRYLHISGRPQNAVHKARETTLLLPRRRVLCFVRVSFGCRQAGFRLRRSRIVRPVPYREAGRLPQGWARHLCVWRGVRQRRRTRPTCQRILTTGSCGGLQ